MIVAFETKSSDELETFLDNYEHPKSLSGIYSKMSFIEFRIHRFDDLVIISQKHLYDVVAKWLILAAFANLLLAYLFQHPLFVYLSFLFVIVGILWLSKWIRFNALRINLKRKGHHFKIRLLSSDEVVDRLLLRFDDGSK